MDMRRTKQFIYGSFYAIFWIVLIGGAYFLFLKPTPSCFDHVQNEGEQGVDCGGPCAMVCIPSDIQTIAVLGTVQSFASTPGRYTFLGQIANANSGFAARSFGYAFTIYDASGTIIQSFPGQSFMYAGEVKYLLAPNEAISDPGDHVGLVVTSPDWVASAALGPVPNFGNTPSLTGESETTSTVTVSGTLTNNDIATFTNVLIVAIFKGGDGTPIGASQTEIDGIAPGASQNFSVIYPAVPNLAPTLTQFYAYALRP